MSTHWTDKRTSVAMVGGELARRGWKLWGWKADHSDSQTDYYDPESWRGVATRDGWTVCVDVGHDVSSRSGQVDARHECLMGPCSPCAGTGKQQRDYDTPGSVMTELCTGNRIVEPAQHYKAGDPCRWCEGSGQREESRQVPDAPVWPTFSANPPGRVWHVERDGRMVASGVGVYAVSNERWQGEHSITKPDGSAFTAPPEAWDDARCSRCGAIGAAHDLRREECPKARPKLKALVDRIEAATSERKRSHTAAEHIIEAQADSLEIRPGRREGFSEIVFTAKPDEATRATLKAAGFRWAPSTACWYGQSDRLPAGLVPA